LLNGNKLLGTGITSCWRADNRNHDLDCDLGVVFDCYFFPAPRHIGLPFNGMANAYSEPVTLNGQMTLIPRATLSPSLARQFAEQILGQLLGASKTAQLSCLASVLRSNGHHAINEFE
jgi:hypothetical protein